MQGLWSILLLVIANVFMTLAWYGHLNYFKKFPWAANLTLMGVILLSWALAFVEYCFQVPANRIGHESHGGPFNLFELKMIQEIVSLVVFSLMAIYIFKTDKLQWNYLAGFVCLLLAAFFIFKKW